MNIWKLHEPDQTNDCKMQTTKIVQPVANSSSHDDIRVPERT